MLKDSGLQKFNAKISDFQYRQVVGALTYLMVETRPDLAYSVGFLSRSLENLSAEDILRVKRVFCYLASTVEYGLTYRSTEIKGVLHCDSDYGGYTKTSRLTSGHVMIYSGGAIS
ncbi:integrase core domain protein [Nephila pilipes]|uniref:Integrase core domain protein n=1 Tax=Nephila pilipes TaxID=299642 RepID=A0A8X6UNH6_NEPPI|nr:integrase core domain protein [Nephila pilipes]